MWTNEQDGNREVSWLLLVFLGYMKPCDEKGVGSVAGKIGQDMINGWFSPRGC